MSESSTPETSKAKTDEDSASQGHEFVQTVNKRLNAMTDRQDSIQALSMWMIHHKSQCQKIASCWLAAVKRAKTSRRLHLFYLANDIVQNCKKKNAKIFLLAFKSVLKDAAVLVRDPSIMHKIERIFDIWEQRNTYFIDFVNELRELLKDREKVTAHVSATNFKPQDAVESLSKVKMLETHAGMKYKQVTNLKIDASRIEAVKQLKDRSKSNEHVKQFDDSYTKISSYVKMLENEVEQRGKLIELLETGQTFYEVQNDDAMVVANAYRNFGIRINNLKKRLHEFKATLSDGLDSPVPSPSAEAPSPENSPPQATDTADDMDMDVSDSEADMGIIIAAEPIKGSSTSLSDRLAAMGNSIPGASADPRSQANTASTSYNATSASTSSAAGYYSPSEQLEREKSSSGGASAINYLSSFISAKASQSPSSYHDKSVLKSLEDFADKVKNPPPASWSDYKRKQQEKLASQVQQSEVKPSASPSLNSQPSASASVLVTQDAEQAQEELTHQAEPQNESDRQQLSQQPHIPPQTSNTPPLSQPAVFSPQRSEVRTLHDSNQPPVQTTQPPNNDQAVRQVVPPMPRPMRPPTISPLRPPPAPVITVRPSLATRTIQISPAVAVQAPVPQEVPGVISRRSLSVEDQQGALDLLDNIHDRGRVASHYHPEYVDHNHGRGQPIRTLSDRKPQVLEPVVRGGGLGPSIRPPPHRYPPRRPYDDRYDDNQYPYPPKRPYDEYRRPGYDYGGYY